MIKATFSDFRLVRTRSIVQLIFELPIEQADSALAELGGIPQPSQERWVDIGKTELPEEGWTVFRPKPSLTEPEKLRLRAVMLCKDVQFQNWLGMDLTEEDAANWLRSKLGIASRSELVVNEAAQQAFLQIENTYKVDVGLIAEKRG